MAKKLLVVDLDGTVANFVKSWTSLLDLPEDVVRCWDFLPVTPFATWDQFWSWAKGEQVFLRAEAYPGAVDGVRQLVRMGDVMFSTHRPAWARQETYHWLKMHDLWLPVQFRVPKWQAGADLYVDDGPHIIRDIREHQIDANVIRMVRPWNEPVEGVVDAHNWTQVVVAAKKLLERRPSGGHSAHAME